MTRMTSKGQVTIPTHIRDKLGVSAGDEIGVREDGQGRDHNARNYCKQ